MVLDTTILLKLILNINSFFFLRLLPYSDVLLKVTIVPRTSLALGFAQYTPSEQKLYSKEEVKLKYNTPN